jgi:hypothetical protein
MSVVDKLDVVWEGCRNSISQFVTRLQEIIEHGDPESRDYCLRVLATTLVSRYNHRTRAALKQTTAIPLPRGRVKVQLPRKTVNSLVTRLERLSAGILASWMIGRTPLGEASYDMLLEREAAESASGRGHARNAEFYRQLRARLNPQDIVADKWSDQEVMTIKNEIWLILPPPAATKALKGTREKTKLPEV